MELGKNSDTSGQGSGEAGCACTAATGCGGEMHNANTITAWKTLSIKKVRRLTEVVITLGKVHNHQGVIPSKFADVMKAWSTLGITAE